MNLLEMERENSTMDFEQYGMGWNLKNWPFDIIGFLPAFEQNQQYLKFLRIRRL
jgi:hypothetical protein